MSVPGEDKVSFVMRIYCSRVCVHVQAGFHNHCVLSFYVNRKMFPNHQDQELSSNTIFPCFILVEVRKLWKLTFKICIIQMKEI
jgi:hypothetical protein